jgi:predicted nucleic acid-binding protein
MKAKIFFDSDVILDIALERRAFLRDSLNLINFVEHLEYAGFTSSNIFTNVYYISKKLTNHTAAINFLKKIRSVLKVLNVDDTIIQKALDSDWQDFEDAVQYFTAIQNKCNFIITRNKDDYKKSNIPVYTPTEYLNMDKIRNRTKNI